MCTSYSGRCVMSNYVTLRKLNQLKKIRNEKREEIAQDSVFVPILYGPDMSNPEGGDMMGGGMPM